MAQLTLDQKRQIVETLACFKRPAEVAAIMRAEHDIDIDVKQIVKYDPTRSTFEGAEDFRVIFEVTRKAFLEDVNAVPIASQAYRLQMLQENFEDAVKKGNRVLANATLKQAAEEIGGVLTNERNLTVDKKGGALADLTPEERRAAAADLLRAVMERSAPQLAAPSPTPETSI